MENMNKVQGNKIQGVNENSYMYKCYFGCMAKITSFDIVNFLQGFIRGLNGEIDVIYSKNQNGEVEGMLAIPYRANSSQNNNNNMGKGLIPVAGLNGGRGGKINDQVLKSIDRIKIPGESPTVLAKEDAILFRIDFAALVAEMMNPEKGYIAAIDPANIKLTGPNEIIAIVEVFRDNKKGQQNRMSRVLQGQSFNRRQGGGQPQRYNGGRR